MISKLYPMRMTHIMYIIQPLSRSELTKPLPPLPLVSYCTTHCTVYLRWFLMGVTYMQLLFSAHETSQDRILATPLSPTPPPSPSIPHRTAMFARLEVTDEWRRPLVSFDSFLDICIFRKSLILGACAVTPGWLISAWLVWIFVWVRWGLRQKNGDNVIHLTDTGCFF